MSTEYPLVVAPDRNGSLFLIESSCSVEFNISFPSSGVELVNSLPLSADQLRAAIIKQIEVLSYISDDPEEVLRRFNVNYGQTQ